VQESIDNYEFSPFSLNILFVNFPCIKKKLCYNYFYLLQGDTADSVFLRKAAF